VSFVSLVNLLAGRRVVAELLQGALTPRNVASEAARVWGEGPKRRAMVEELRRVRELLGRPDASARAAEEVLALIDERSATPGEARVLRGAPSAR